MLKDIDDLGERYNVVLRTALQSRTTAESAILKVAARGYDLILTGVTRRPGEQLCFGNTAGGILKKWKSLMLFVAS